VLPINKSASQDDTPLVPGGKLLDLGINFATYEPFFIPLGAPVFAAAGLASVIDPDSSTISANTVLVKASVIKTSVMFNSFFIF
jgi:hypothetical protein